MTITVSSVATPALHWFQQSPKSVEVETTVGVEELFRLHSPAVFRYARKALHGDSDSADDIVQQVFFAVWKQYQRDFAGRPPAQAIRLIMRIAVRRVADARRSRVIILGLTDDPLDTVMERPTESMAVNPAEQVLAADAVTRFWHVLSHELTRTEYQVALMAWELDLPDAEIAKATGSSVSTVRSHKSRARRKIERVMNRSGTRIEFPFDENTPETSESEVSA